MSFIKWTEKGMRRDADILLFISLVSILYLPLIISEFLVLLGTKAILKRAEDEETRRIAKKARTIAKYVLIIEPIALIIIMFLNQ